MNINTPKGTRDFSPAEMVRRNYIFDTIKGVFKKYGYQPIETPAMENSETLMGKYGEEGDRLIFKILNSGDFLKRITLSDEDIHALVDTLKKRGERYKHSDLSEVKSSNGVATEISEKALRYDLTVPFARYVVQHRNEITFPFKRYQVQPVWRADRPQKGRYREFYQCDIDVIGSDSLLNEVEMVQVVDEVFSKLNVPVTVKINNRKLLAAIAEVIGAPDAFVDITVALDKLDKIGEEKVCNELRERGISNAPIEKLLPLMRFQGNTAEKLEFLKTYLGSNETGQKGIAEVSEVLGTAQQLISNKTVLELDLTLARGLNYYTGAIFEVRSNIDGTLSSSISGGGRYDDLTGIFGMPDVSGVGISFGADRIYDVLQEADLFPEFTSDSTQVFFVNFGEKEAAYCLGLCKQLREAGINTELYPESAKMKKQMTYANNNQIPFVAMVGTQEMEAGTIGLKNMVTGEQSSVSVSELIQLIKG
ncbi:MAG: histidine--tRNA ligase [Flavobacteriales bacterium]|nr:histidine--tRNA ligase [Flavobacteriales bacterium]